MITLNLSQSLDLIKSQFKKSYFHNNFRIYCTTQTPCLHCGNPVYVGYTKVNIGAIFCDDCYPMFQRKRTIVQYHYMRRVKELQLLSTQMRLNTSPQELPDKTNDYIPQQDFSIKIPHLRQAPLYERTPSTSEFEEHNLEFLENF